MGWRCGVEDCSTGQAHYALGLCRTHWKRLRKYGDPSIASQREAEIRQGFITCVTCKKQKSLTELHQRADSRGGYGGQCKPCKAPSEASRSKRYADAHREERRAKSMEYHRTVRSTPEAREAAVRRTLAWAKENPERHRKQKLIASQKRRALKAGAFVEDIDPIRVFDRDGWECYLCGGLCDPNGPKRDRPSVDHIIALARGGEHSYENVATAHVGCNSAKGVKLVEEVMV